MSMRKTSGFTLREVMLAMVLGSTVFICATGLVQHAFNWSATGRDRRQDDQTFFRLREDLTADLHLATEVQVGEDHLKLAVSNGSEVIYQIESRVIRRSETGREGEVKREAYRWKIQRQAVIRELETNGQIELGLSTATPGVEQTRTWRTTRASVGLRLKHERGDIE